MQNWNKIYPERQTHYMQKQKKAKQKDINPFNSISITSQFLQLSQMDKSLNFNSSFVKVREFYDSLKFIKSVYRYCV